MDKIVAFQGEMGAHSHKACLMMLPDWKPRPSPTFEDAFAAVMEERAARAMIPIENSIAGRVADIHHLLPKTDLFVTGEYFLKVHHQLLGIQGAKIEDIKKVHSHQMALGQCRKLLQELGAKSVVEADTAGSARELAERQDKSHAAIAADLAAEIHGLQTLRSNIEDAEANITRFLLFSKKRDDAPPSKPHIITSLLFRVRNIPAALYKALGGFATNGVNITRLESCQIEGRFEAAQFYADIEGHCEGEDVRRALDELAYYSSQCRILGSYEAAPFRRDN